MTTPEWILPFRSAPWFGRIMAVLGLAGIAFALLVATTTPGGLLISILAASFPALLGVLLASGGALLMARRGGIELREDAIVWYGDRPESSLTIPRSAMVALVIEERPEGDPDTPIAVATAEIVLDSGVRVVLAEGTDRDVVEPLAQRMSATLGLRTTAPAGPPSDRASSSHDLRVGAQGALPKTLGVTAIAMLVGGVIAILDVKRPVVGTFVGTPLIALGLALGAVALVKRWLVERLELHADGHFSHEYRLGTLHWGRREGRADPAGAVRLRQRGLLGATLEIVGQRRVQLVAGGVQTGGGGGAFDTQALQRLAETVARWHAGT